MTSSNLRKLTVLVRISGQLRCRVSGERFAIGAREKVEMARGVRCAKALPAHFMSVAISTSQRVSLGNLAARLPRN